MANVNRTVASPWGLLARPDRRLAQRDTGWIQFYVETAQEALDTVLQAYRVAEAVLVPAMINLDAFYVSHSLEPVAVPAQALVDAYLPPFDPPHRLDPQRVESWGNVVSQDMFYRHRQASEDAMAQVPALAAEADRDWAARTGRSWGVVERYRCDDASAVVVTMGSMCGSARVAVDALRDAGEAVGLAQAAPVPAVADGGAARAALAGVRDAVVLDRNHSPGIGGVLHQELRAALYGTANARAHPRSARRRRRRQRAAAAHRRVGARGDRRRRAARTGLGEVSMRTTALSELHADEPMLCAGHAACPGCIDALSVRHVLAGIGPDAVAVIPPSCMAIIAGPQPYSSLKIPVYQPTLESSAAAASGLRRALDAQGKRDTLVVVFAGDGGTYDIGFQCLSSAAERNEDFLYVCLDNEGYMNTGAQKSSSTPHYAKTGSTPAGKLTRKKNLTEIMAAHGVPYVATASAGHLADLTRKVAKAKAMRGTRLLTLLIPWPRRLGRRRRQRPAGRTAGGGDRRVPAARGRGRRALHGQRGEDAADRRIPGGAAPLPPPRLRPGGRAAGRDRRGLGPAAAAGRGDDAAVADAVPESLAAKSHHDPAIVMP
ncbi:MAG: hypothetical protein HS128_07255 [Ideonella sp.]|nr:hypothetical protein [Ideonella sp.]